MFAPIVAQISKISTHAEGAHTLCPLLPVADIAVEARFPNAIEAHTPSKIMLWEKAVRMQATLATRLRLSPQSRVDPKTVGRLQVSHGPRPWEI